MLTRSRPPRPKAGQRNRITIYGYYPCGFRRPCPNEGTREHWVLFLRCGNETHGLLHDIFGQPLAFHRRRLTDVQSTCLGSFIRYHQVGCIEDVASYDRIVSAAHIDNNDRTFNSQHWVLEALEKLNENSILSNADFQRTWDELLPHLE